MASTNQADAAQITPEQPISNSVVPVVEIKTDGAAEQRASVKQVPYGSQPLAPPAKLAPGAFVGGKDRR